MDTETHRISVQNLAPKIVCASAAWNADRLPAADMACTGDAGSLDSMVSTAFRNDTVTKIFHNAAFDLAVLFLNFPDLRGEIYDQLSKGLVHCTILRQKLLYLADQGNLEYEALGKINKKIEYGLAYMAKHQLGIDISGEKDSEDAWRTNYAVLDNIPSSQWPQEAVSYVKNDSIICLGIWEKQEERRKELIAIKGIDPFTTLGFQVCVEFSLYLMSLPGFCIDPVEKAKIKRMVEDELTPEKQNLLLGHGIIRPAEPPQPYANGAKDPETGLPKMTAGKKESTNTKVLHQYVKDLCERDERCELKMTKPSKRYPDGQVCTDAEWRDTHWVFDPVIEQLHNRKKLEKLHTTYLPAMENEDGTDAPVIHTQFNGLVSTGRTSSRSSKLYPSANFQNIDVRVRNCIVPRENYWWFSDDYSGMELATAAQTCIRVIGFSKLGEIINAGIDAHEFLGAQIAMATDESFQKYAHQNSIAATDTDAVYRLFHHVKSLSPEWRAWWKHYRTLAKPTGLGYPGGLGPDTFVAYAKATFGVVVDRDTAVQLRELWRLTFPEMPMYLKWINENAVDHFNTRKEFDEEKQKEMTRRRYQYTSPFGMHRAGCDYCAAANGMALQTPSAEGAKLAIWRVQQEIYDPRIDSPLKPDAHGYKILPLAFVHDELVGEIRKDCVDLLQYVSKIMAESMAVITPDVKASSEAAIMERWDKRAEPVYDAQGNLTIWKPKDASIKTAA